VSHELFSVPQNLAIQANLLTVPAHYDSKLVIQRRLRFVVLLRFVTPQSMECKAVRTLGWYERIHLTAKGGPITQVVKRLQKIGLALSVFSNEENLF